MNGDVLSLFSQALHDYGLTLAPHQIIADGEIHRFGCPGDKDTPCWYVFYAEGIAAGSFGCWKRGIHQRWSEKKLKALKKDARDALILRERQLKAKRDAYIQAEHKAAQIEARKVWDAAEPESGEHAYLRHKGVLPHGLRTDGFHLLVPMFDIGHTLHSLQKIAPNGEKRFFPRARTQGCFYGLGRVRDVIYICEGFSTGATIFELTGCAVAVAFTCGNLLAVAKALRKRYANARLVVAADDDRYHVNGTNAGLEKATETAQALGLELVVPQFTDRKDKPTDFNDMRALEGDTRTRYALTQNTFTKSLSLESMVGMAIERRDCLLHPWLPSQGICMVHAPRGIGKTWFSMYLAYAISHGFDFLTWQVKRVSKVMYIDGEMPALALQDRFKTIQRSYQGESGDALRIITPDLQPNGMLDLSNRQDHSRLAFHVEFADLIIVDNLSCLARSYNENEQESWLPVSEWAQHQRAMGRSVLFIHHSGKTGKQRGTSRREDLLDTVINLRQPPGYKPSDGCVFEIHFEKSRGFYGEAAKSFEATLIHDEHGRLQWVTQSIEQSLDERLRKLQAEGVSIGEMASILGVHRSTVFRRLRALKNR